MAQAKKNINKHFIINLIIGIVYAIGYYFVFDGNAYIKEIEYKAIVTNDMDFDRAISAIKTVQRCSLFCHFIPYLEYHTCYRKQTSVK